MRAVYERVPNLAVLGKRTAINSSLPFLVVSLPCSAFNGAPFPTGGDANVILRQLLAPGSVSVVVVNHPEPPRQDGQDMGGVGGEASHSQLR